MTESEFTSRLEELRDEGYTVGLRGQDVEFPEVGGFIDHASSIWSGDEYDEGDDTYDGTCAMSLESDADVERALRSFRLFGHTNRPGETRYVYDHVAVVVGDLCDVGQDEGEIVISDATVAMVVS